MAIKDQTGNRKNTKAAMHRTSIVARNTRIRKNRSSLRRLAMAKMNCRRKKAVTALSGPVIARGRTALPSRLTTLACRTLFLMASLTRCARLA